MKAIEEVDVEKLVEVCKQVNEVVDNKIEVVGVSTPDLINGFTAALESMSDEQQDKCPGAVEFYNDLYKDEAAKTEGEGEGKTEPPPDSSGEGETKETKAPANKKKKKSAAKKKKKEPKEPKPPKEKDEFGFTVGTKNSQFMQAIKAQPMTMKEVRELPWNEKKVTFYEMFKKQKAAGKVDKDEQGRMFVK